MGQDASALLHKFTNELERLDIKYNIALIPFFNEKQDLPSFAEFVDKIKSCRRCEIVLHGLYHENRNGHFDDFHNVKKAAAEEEIRVGLEIFQRASLSIKLNNSFELENWYSRFHC
jgi:predicted deacetylase